MHHRDIIWISAVEPSADLHGSNLIKELKRFFPNFEFVGIGGPRMRKEGLRSLYPAEDLSVMGLIEVISSIPKFFMLYGKIKEFLKRSKPFFMVLIDAPDFHFKIAKVAYSLSIPVFYYISPQVWAWRKSRIKFLKKYVKKLFCIFPFEEAFFKKHGLDVEYVGHPLMEEIDFKTLSSVKPVKRKIILLPGSRKKEVISLMPEFFKASLIIKSKYPDTSFTLIKASNIENSDIFGLWNIKKLPLELISKEEEKYKKMKEGEVAIAASGTATLECGLLNLPCVVTYKVSLLSYLIARWLVDAKYISMTNIILNEKVFPEFIQDDANAENIASQVIFWFKRPEILQKIRDRLNDLKTIIGNKKASYNCAKSIWECVCRS